MKLIMFTNVILKRKFAPNAGFGLIEVMIAAGIMAALSLGMATIVQQMTKSNLGVEQKQNSLLLGSEINAFLASSDNCTFNFGRTAPVATLLSEFPKAINQLTQRTGGAPLVVYQVYDGTPATLYYQMQIRNMTLDNFIPLRDSTGAFTPRGEATFTYTLDKNVSSEGSDSYKTRQFKVEIQLEANFNPAGVNRIDNCTAIGGSLDAIWIRKANNDIYYNEGNVAIGTQDPLAPLHVSATGAWDPIALFSGTGATDSVALSVGNSANNMSLAMAGAANAFTPGTVNGDAVIRYSAGRSLLFSNGGVRTDMVIDAAGKVRMGSGTSTSGNVVNVVGSTMNQVNITYQANAGWGFLLGNDAPGTAVATYHGPLSAYMINVGAGPLHLGTSNASRMTIVAGGNVGIGNTAPTEKLEVTGNVLVNGILKGAAGATSSGFTTMTAGSFIATSDERLKRNVTELDPQLKKLLSIKTFQYQYKSQAPDDKKIHYGVIAQKIQSQYPDLVDKGADGNLGVNYVEMVPLLIKSMQEMQQKIDQLERKIQVLENPTAGKIKKSK